MTDPMTPTRDSGRNEAHDPIHALKVLSREMAFASVETRQRLLVKEEYWSHTPSEAWERLTEFQRDQWIGRAALVLERALTTPSTAETER